MHSKPAPFLCITASLQTVFQLHEFIVSSQRKKVSPLLSNGKVQRNLNHTKGSIDIYIYLFKLAAKSHVCIAAGPRTHFGKRIY